MNARTRFRRSKPIPCAPKLCIGKSLSQPGTGWHHERKTRLKHAMSYKFYFFRSWGEQHMLQDWGIDNVTAAPEKVYTWYFFYLIGHPKSIVWIESFHPVVQHARCARVAGWSGIMYGSGGHGKEVPFRSVGEELVRSDRVARAPLGKSDVRSDSGIHMHMYCYNLCMRGCVCCRTEAVHGPFERAARCSAGNQTCAPFHTHQSAPPGPPRPAKDPPVSERSATH